jgi:hypothetical protein
MFCLFQPTLPLPPNVLNEEESKTQWSLRTFNETLRQFFNSCKDEYCCQKRTALSIRYKRGFFITSVRFYDFKGGLRYFFSMCIHTHTRPAFVVEQFFLEICIKWNQLQLKFFPHYLKRKCEERFHFIDRWNFSQMYEIHIFMSSHAMGIEEKCLHNISQLHEMYIFLLNAHTVQFQCEREREVNTPPCKI